MLDVIIMVIIAIIGITVTDGVVAVVLIAVAGLVRKVGTGGVARASRAQHSGERRIQGRRAVHRGGPPLPGSLQLDAAPKSSQDS